MVWLGVIITFLGWLIIIRLGDGSVLNFHGLSIAGHVIDLGYLP
jgi:hypothetical protein